MFKILINSVFNSTRILSKRRLAFPKLAPNRKYSQQLLPTKEIPAEVQHHVNLADDWWNINGPMRALHALNAIRVPFIRDGLITYGSIDAKLLNTPRVLVGQKVLEVGCGGGILSEQLARLHAQVTGIDLGDQLIETAREHLAKESPELSERICYQIEPIAAHVKHSFEQYDAVVVSEVLEHVDDKADFLTNCIQALKPGGSIFITTLNQTVPMWLGGILLGEYILKLAPEGTHHWDKLVKPSDLERMLEALQCRTVVINGSTYDFWRNSWRWINSTSMCYAVQAVKLETK